jgi:centromere/kinetochore protein ZW10
VEGEKRWRLEQGSADNLTVLRLTSCDPRRPAEVLSDTSTLLQFAANTVFPSSTPPIPERESFLSELRHATNTAVLDFVLLPSMPSSVPSVPGWLDLLLQAVDSEASLPGVSGNEVIKPFFESEAGSAWASQRRRSVAEEVRKLITGAWGGWEAVEAEREKEITVVVEVEVEEDNLGWGFEDKTKPPKTKPVEPEPAAKTSDAGEMQVDEDEGWGFEYGANAGLSSSHQESAMNGDAAGPSEDAETEGDGWDFEISEPTAPEPVPVARPAREAKRLGRKLAKAKTAEPVEEEGWKSESSMKSGMVAEVTAAEENAGRNSRAAADSWGDWTEDVPRAAATNTSPVKLKRTVLKEEKRVIKEHFLVSQACDKLLEFAVRMLQEAQDLHNTRSVPSSAGADKQSSLVVCIYRGHHDCVRHGRLRRLPRSHAHFLRLTATRRPDTSHAVRQ